MRGRLLMLAVTLLGVPTARAAAQEMPRDWNGDGLVVGQIAGTSVFGLTIGGEKWTRIRVGRRPPDGGVFRGLILFKRGEGEHELASIYEDIGGRGTVLPIGRKFETKKGQITVLGMMVCVPNSQDRKQYQIRVYDNTDETIDYLRRMHPEVLAGHENAQIILAPGNVLPKERLVALRTNVARFEARKTKRQGQFWVAGMAGTIAEVNVSGDSVRVLRFLPPVMYQEPVRSSYDSTGVLNIAGWEKRWRVVNGRIEELPPLTVRDR